MVQTEMRLKKAAVITTSERELPSQLYSSSIFYPF